MTAEQDVSISGLLTEDLVLVGLPCQDTAQTLETLVRKVSEVKAIKNFRGILDKILERETEGIDTTLDTGLSLPHVYLPDLSGTAAALGILSRPIPDPKNPTIGIRAMLLLLSADQPEFYKQHLRLLRNIARLFKPALIDRLADAKTAAQAIEIIRRQEMGANP